MNDKNKEIMRIRSVFPFDLFPNTIILQKNKIDIIHRPFFYTKQVFTVFINDIRTVKINSGPFFASLSFELKGMVDEQNPEPIHFLRKKSAQKLRKLALNLCITHSHKKTKNVVKNSKLS